MAEQNKDFQEYSISIDPSIMNINLLKDLEWILTNGIGGYSSSTVTGMNTRRYHGLLISSSKDLDRKVYLQKLDEKIISNNKIFYLSTNEYSGNVINPNGFKYLKNFEYNPKSVMFYYYVNGVEILKKIQMFNGKNAIIVSYHINNNMTSEIEVYIEPLINSRSIHSTTKENSISFRSSYKNQRIDIASSNGYIIAYTDNKNCIGRLDDKWHKNLFYSKEYERGEESCEDSYCPGNFSIKIPPAEKENFKIIFVGYETEGDTKKIFDEICKTKILDEEKILTDHKGKNIVALILNTNSFIIDHNSRKSVIAGYHWFGEWSRDAMIALPGLALITGKYEIAESIIEYFLNYVKDGRIPTEFQNGQPGYNDIDSSLWLIDRVYQYMKYAGIDKGKEFLSKHWSTLKDIIKNYAIMEKNGLIFHKSGTWMDTLERSNAVEIQGLWYNSLRIMEKLSRIMNDPLTDIDIKTSISKFEKNFMNKFWNRNYLRDCLGDDTLRPNQIIVLSLDYNIVDNERGIKILDIVKKELLTPFGLRTLNRVDSRYKGVYVGNPHERELAYHNGTVWPWLLGPYIKSCVKFYGENYRDSIGRILDPLFEQHIREAGLCTISEIFDGDPPHTPRGCISQAWSVAELLRAYFEDILGKRPTYERILMDL